MAFQYWRLRGQSRRKFIALREGYHGDTIGAVSVGGIDLFHEAFRPLLFETTFVDSPNPFHYSLSHPEFAPGRARDDLDEAVSQEVLDRIDEVLSTGPRQYCAVIVEPLVQAAAGMLTHPRGFLKGLRELTRRRGVLLIADEVATGFARTGTMFACQQEEVCPDLMCLGKGLSGGYLPVSATLTSQEIFEAFCGDGPCGGYGGQTFLHGHTFAGNALGCAAACASIDLIHSSGLLAALPSRIALIRRRLAPLADHPHAGDIRQCGMMAGIDLVADRASGTFFDPGLRVGAGVCRAAIRRGIMIRPLGDVVVLMPAPAMDLPTLDRLVSGVVESIHEHFPGKGV
jgi:adenosylmethionine-8-amino-7-oxononanoate aminotransferase